MHDPVKHVIMSFKYPNLEGEKIFVGSLNP